MATVSETIPELLQSEVDAALSWFNKAQSENFEVTGIVDADVSLQSSEPRALRLVLCGGDTCQQHTFQVSSARDGFDVCLLNPKPQADDVKLQAELDPPPGARREWLDTVLSKHKFVVFIFYRGFW